VRLVVLALVVACGAHPPRARPGIHDDEDAIEAFQQAWARDVRPRIADPLVRRIDTRMQTTSALGRYYAERHECREGVRRISELESIRQNIEGETSIVVHGNVDALLGRQQCWSVMFLGGMPRLDAEGWLDPSGRLLVAWRIPH
jgi:hypothetical protein